MDGDESISLRDRVTHYRWHFLLACRSRLTDGLFVELVASFALHLFFEYLQRIRAWVWAASVAGWFIARGLWKVSALGSIGQMFWILDDNLFLSVPFLTLRISEFKRPCVEEIRRWRVTTFLLHWARPISSVHSSLSLSLSLLVLSPRKSVFIKSSIFITPSLLSNHLKEILAPCSSGQQQTLGVLKECMVIIDVVFKTNRKDRGVSPISSEEVRTRLVIK